MTAFIGMNLKNLEKAARRLGVTIERPRGTGEVRFSHPMMEKSVKQNARRKDATREVIVWMKRLQNTLQFIRT